MNRRLYRSLPQMFDDDPPGGGDPPNPDPPKPKKFEWDEEQQAEIKRIATKEAKEAARVAREAALAEVAAKKAADDEEAKRKKQVEAGEFETVKTSLEQARDTAISERDALKDEHETLRTYVTADIAAAVKDLPKTLVAFDPGEDAPIGQRLAWLTKAKAAAAEMEKSSPRGNGPNPKPGGNVQINERQEIDRVRSSISL
jgi:hypothetical protein